MAGKKSSPPQDIINAGFRQLDDDILADEEYFADISRL